MFCCIYGYRTKLHVETQIVCSKLLLCFNVLIACDVVFKLLVKWGYIVCIIRGLIGFENGVEMGKGMQICDLIAGRNNLIAGRNKEGRARNFDSCKSCGPQPPHLRAARRGVEKWQRV